MVEAPLNVVVELSVNVLKSHESVTVVIKVNQSPELRLTKRFVSNFLTSLPS